MNSFISYNQYKKNIVLNETYESYVELKQLAQDIIDICKNDDKYNTQTIFPINKFVIRKYKIINNLINSGVGITLGKKTSTLKSGSFMGPKNYKNLSNFYNFNVLIEKFPDGVISLHGFDVSSLIHELQHAYDSIRSNEKYVSTKLGLKYTELAKDYSDNETYSDKFKKRYYRTPHELSAFFVKTLNDINFFYDEKEMNLKDFHTLYDEFKENFQGYDYLTSKDKKILARKFSQYYYKLKERNITDE
jgi:hypothetical protein